jgi:hypothetical protein
VQVQKSLEVNYDDHGSYPTTSGNWYTDCATGWADSPNLAPNDIVPGLAPTYVPEIKSDPMFVSGGITSCTLYISDGREYKFSLWGLRDPSSGAAVFDYSGYSTFRDPRTDGGADPCVLEGTGIDDGSGMGGAWAIQTDGLCASHPIW